MEPTQEQFKAFWERHGFRHFVETKYGRAVDMWEYPKPYGIKRNRSYLPDADLNNLFKYAVPFLLEEYNIESYSFKQGDGPHQGDSWYYSETNIWRKGSTKHGFEVLHDEHIAKHFEQGANLDKITALALFWALKKVEEADANTH